MSETEVIQRLRTILAALASPESLHGGEIVLPAVELRMRMAYAQGAVSGIDELLVLR